MGKGNGTWALTLIVALIGANAAWDMHCLSGMTSDISSIRDEMNDMKTSLELLRNDMKEKNSPAFHGNIPINNTTSRNISILLPSNGSIFNLSQPIFVKGWATLHSGDYVFVISKIGKKYWVSNDCSISPNGKWEGSSEYIFPNFEDNEAKTYEMFAIITNELLGIGKSYDDVPPHLSRSASIYITKLRS